MRRKTLLLSIFILIAMLFSLVAFNSNSDPEVKPQENNTVPDSSVGTDSNTADTDISNADTSQEEQASALYEDLAAQYEDLTNQTDQSTTITEEDVLLKIEQFIEQLKASDFRKMPEESGYECIYDGSIEYKEYTLFYNQSAFAENNFIHFVLINHLKNDAETLYDVDTDSQLSADFNALLDLF